VACHNVENPNQEKHIGGVEFIQENHANGKGEKGAQVTQGAGDLHAIKAVFWLVLPFHVPPYIPEQTTMSICNV